jgi:hypothetical protein
VATMIPGVRPYFPAGRSMDSFVLFVGVLVDGRLSPMWCASLAWCCFLISNLLLRSSGSHCALASGFGLLRDRCCQLRSQGSNAVVRQLFRYRVLGLGSPRGSGGCEPWLGEGQAAAACQRCSPSIRSFAPVAARFAIYDGATRRTEGGRYRSGAGRAWAGEGAW